MWGDFLQVPRQAFINMFFVFLQLDAIVCDMSSQISVANYLHLY